MVAAPSELIRRTAKRGKSVSANVRTCRAGTNGGKAMESRTLCLVRLNPFQTQFLRKQKLKPDVGNYTHVLGLGSPGNSMHLRAVCWAIDKTSEVKIELTDCW